MGDSDGKEQIDQLFNVLDQLEQAEQRDPALLDWLSNICQREFGLVNALVLNFMENIPNAAFSKKILKVLRKMCYFLEDLVVPQFKEDKNFPLAIVTYISDTPSADLTGDAFILLVKIFSASNFKNVTNDKFLNALFNSLEFITDEKIFEAMVSIIVSVSYESESQSSNLVLKQLESHQNARYFGETLLHLLNRGDYEEADRCLRCLLDIFDYEKTASFFYSNDISLLTDICLRGIISTSNPEKRFLYLCVISKFLETPEYKKYRFKIDDIGEMVNCLSEEENLDDRTTDLIAAIQNKGYF